MTCKDTAHRADLVVIGNGIAGMTAAIEARRLAPALSIAIITEQNYPAINTPVLKQLCAGVLEPSQLLAYPAGTERAQHLAMIHARVERINAAGKELFLADGSRYGYSTLLIATGSRPVGLSPTLPGRGLDGVLVLHRLHDYQDLARRLQVRGSGEINEVVVVGGGVHAAETALWLQELGCRVRWLIRGDRFCPRVLDSRASELALAHVRRMGIQIWLNTEVKGIVGKVGTVAGVVTTKHSSLPCQLVLACTGTTPLMTLADSCDPPLEHRWGILVDDHLQTSVKDIYAAGDVAALKNPWTGAYEPQAHWAAAGEQGKSVAAAITGHPDLLKQALGAPWHATQLADLSLLTVGMPLLTRGTEFLVNTCAAGYYRLTVAQNRLIGYLALSLQQQDGVGIKHLIDEAVDCSKAADMLLTGTFDARSFFAQHHTVHLLSESTPQLLSQQRTRGTGGQVRTVTGTLRGERTLLPIASYLQKGLPLQPHKPWSHIAREVQACIGCNECLYACPALSEPLGIDILNQETLSGPRSEAVIHFVRSCYQCGACVAPCPVGLHRDAMMMWLKVCLLRGQQAEQEVPYATP